MCHMVKYTIGHSAVQCAIPHLGGAGQDVAQVQRGEVRRPARHVVQHAVRHLAPEPPGGGAEEGPALLPGGQGEGDGVGAEGWATWGGGVLGLCSLLLRFGGFIFCALGSTKYNINKNTHNL